MEDHHPKPVVVPLIVRMIVVPLGHTGVVMIVVPRAASQRRSSGLNLNSGAATPTIPNGIVSATLPANDPPP